MHGPTDVFPQNEGLNQPTSQESETVDSGTLRYSKGETVDSGTLRYSPKEKQWTVALSDTGEIVDSGTLRHTRLSRPQGSTNSKLEQQRNSGQWHSPT
ncbi:unnamed protein product [Rodentolepis nana]|uniref:Lipoprotein n=1 Tax=Rodentolepis nana TaxID=102285 RepID=A0A0R3TNV6_RODNA|nr:unnamed protein product [Rodentolepis nana]